MVLQSIREQQLDSNQQSLPANQPLVVPSVTDGNTLGDVEGVSKLLRWSYTSNNYCILNRTTSLGICFNPGGVHFRSFYELECASQQYQQTTGHD